MKLAQLQLESLQPAAALSTLEALPGASASRALLLARADLALGRVDAALDALADRHDPQSEALRADTLEQRQDWAGEAASLERLLVLQAPPAGPLDGAQQDLVLRLAGAAARAGDQGELRQIANAWSVRLTDPRRRATLQVLTEDHVVAAADLARSAADLKMARLALQAAASSAGGT